MIMNELHSHNQSSETFKWKCLCTVLQCTSTQVAGMSTITLKPIAGTVRITAQISCSVVSIII